MPLEIYGDHQSKYTHCLQGQVLIGQENLLLQILDQDLLGLEVPLEWRVSSVVEAPIHC